MQNQQQTQASSSAQKDSDTSNSSHQDEKHTIVVDKQPNKQNSLPKASCTSNIITKRSRKVGRWYLGETLGKGGYSWVKKGYDCHNGRVVALKFTRKFSGSWLDSQALKRVVENEINALRHIRNRHVIRLLGYNLNIKYPKKNGGVIPTVLLILEYLAGGELFEILNYTQESLKENIARTYFHQLIDGIFACHTSGICHRDIKPQNLLLDSHFRLKIADFGLSKVFNASDIDLHGNLSPMETFNVGTHGFQAPEILNCQKYTFSCDIFSCGVVLFILLAGYPPFEYASSQCRWYLPLMNGNVKKFWKQHHGCGISSGAKDIITRMLWYEKDKRITLNGIKRHRWYNIGCLSCKELAIELRTLHAKMMICRKYDTRKQCDLDNSNVVYRSIATEIGTDGKKCAITINSNIDGNTQASDNKNTNINNNKIDNEVKASQLASIAIESNINDVDSNNNNNDHSEDDLEMKKKENKNTKANNIDDNIDAYDKDSTDHDIENSSEFENYSTL